jgi:hypothetical protein
MPKNFIKKVFLFDRGEVRLKQKVRLMVFFMLSWVRTAVVSKGGNRRLAPSFSYV